MESSHPPIPFDQQSLVARFALPVGWLSRHRIAIEGGVPVYQDLNGPQLETDWTLMVDYPFAF